MVSAKTAESKTARWTAARPETTRVASSRACEVGKGDRDPSPHSSALQGTVKL